MRLHKSNLTAIDVTTSDKKTPLLYNLRIEPDGTTVACNREAILIVSPVASGFSDEGCDSSGSDDSDGNNNDTGFTIAGSTITEVLKSLPRGTGYDDLLDFTDVDHEEDGRVIFRFTDGIRRRAVEAKEYGQPYVRYRDILKKRTASKGSVKLVLNRKRMADVFKTLSKVAPDPSGEFPVFMEFSEDAVILRCMHPKTQQRVVCVVNQAYTSKWMDEDDWEKELTKTKKKTIRAKKIKK